VASAARLYTSDVLALATSLAAWPFDPDMPFTGQARSQSCGSTLALSIAIDDAGKIAGLGLRAQACAIGQASAAVFARAAVGRTRAEIAVAAEAISSWLGEGGPEPDWPGIGILAPAASFPARHGAILLAWKAALDALPTA